MIRYNVSTEGRGQSLKRRERDVSRVHTKIRSTSSSAQQRQPDPALVDAAWKARLQGASPTVALGKFDALHRGHRKLVTTAANLKPSSTPYLISFDGMADVLGWEPRLPLVAPCDRPRVLASWEKACAGVVPQERGIPFSQVRHLSPEDFVALLAEDLGAVGVVVGSNYRFGYKAAGTAETLKKLGGEYGMKVEVVNLVERVGGVDTKGAGHGGLADTVSSSAVREALAAGDMVGVKECMGRPYRLVGRAKNAGDARELGFKTEASRDKDVSNVSGEVCMTWRIDSAEFLNQYPAAGIYKVKIGFAADDAGCACVDEAMLYPGQAIFDARGAVTINVEGGRDELSAWTGPLVSERRCLVEFV